MLDIVLQHPTWDQEPQWAASENRSLEIWNSGLLPESDLHCWRYLEQPPSGAGLGMLLQSTIEFGSLEQPLIQTPLQNKAPVTTYHPSEPPPAQTSHISLQQGKILCSTNTDPKEPDLHLKTSRIRSISVVSFLIPSMLAIVHMGTN